MNDELLKEEWRRAAAPRQFVALCGDTGAQSIFAFSVLSLTAPLLVVSNPKSRRNTF